MTDQIGRLMNLKEQKNHIDIKSADDYIFYKHLGDRFE